MSRPLVAALAIAACVWTSAAAQDKPVPPPAQAGFTGPRIPLRVQVVMSRYQGEKKVSSLPYVLGVLANGQKTSLRMGIQVPILMGMKTESPVMPPSYNYKDVGTNIDCQAQDAGTGQYSLNLVIEDTSIHVDSSAKSDKQIARDVPAFRSFNASFGMLLRDGQTLQYASATDPISGEVMKIDITLTIVK
jgi:hypothetical protein